MFKSVFGGNSSGVFCGKIFVEKKAQKSSAFQQNNNLIISDGATVNAKPQLEIFADDVECSHGCTMGEINSEALLYLRSRGIPKKEAINLLVMGFLDDVILTVKNKNIKDRLILLFLQKRSNV